MHGSTDALVALDAPADATVREGCPSSSEALDAFLLDRELAGLSRATLRPWASYLKPLRSDRPVSSVAPDELRALLLVRLRRSSNSAFALHTALDRFFDYCLERRWIERSPLADIPRPRKKPPAHRYFSKVEVGKLFAAAGSDENRAILGLLMCGLRASELLRLEWGDLGADGRMLVRSAKRGRPRHVWLDEGTRAALAVIPRSGTTLFPCSYNALRERLQRLGARAGVTVRAHDFRRTFASHAALQGMNVASVQRLGGWANPQMAMFYARSALDEAALADAERFDLTSRLLED